jgi:chromosome segregation ATPase
MTTFENSESNAVNQPRPANRPSSGSLMKINLVLLLLVLFLFGAFLVVSLRSAQRIEENLNSRLGPIEQDYQVIKPALDEIRGLERTVPMVRDAALLYERQEERINDLDAERMQIGRRVSLIDSTLKDFTLALERLQEADALLAGLRSELVRQNELVRELAQKQENSSGALGGNLEQLSNRLRNLEAGRSEAQEAVRELQSTLKHHIARATQHDEDSSRLLRRVADLEDRVSVRFSRQETLESGVRDRIDSLERRLRRIEAGP